MNAAAPFRAVVLDWRGTLVTTLTGREWVRLALAVDGREGGDAAVADVLERLRTVRDRLDDPLADVDAQMHRAHLMSAFTDAGIDDALAGALYAVESDTAHNPFALDVEPTLRALRERGLGVAVLSDIHVDVRPAFDAGGMSGLVDARSPSSTGPSSPTRRCSP